MIVNGNWLNFLSISNQLQKLVSRSLLIGQWDAATFKAASDVDQSFLRAKAAQIVGRPERIIRELTDSTISTGAEVDLERDFLKGFAFSRLGRTREAETVFAALPARFGVRIGIERALRNLNKGDFVTAAGQFATAYRAATAPGLDPFSACTLLGGMALAHIHLGEFRAAERCLIERRKVLTAYPSPILSFGTRLYEILLRLERNDYPRVEKLLRDSFAEESDDSVNRYFLLHLQLRLRLARNELQAGASTLAELKRLSQELGLPEGVLDFRVEEIEWYLRSRQPAAARAAIDALRAEPTAHEDRYLEFRLGIFEAQVHHQTGNYEAALAQIKRALAIGEEGRYRPLLAWAFLQAGALSVRAGHPVQARLFLNRGHVLATALGLRVRQAAYAYVSEILTHKHAQGSALIGLARHPEIGIELEHLLDAYRLLDGLEFTMVGAGPRDAVAEPHLRRMLLRHSGLFWFQRESVLVANLGEDSDGHAVRTAEFTVGSPLLTAFRLLWSEARLGHPGLTLPQIHKARVPHPYREELHAAAAKMLISRLRSLLKDLACEIRFNRQTQRYALVSPLTAFTILSREGEPGAAAALDRTQELLARIAMEPFVSTAKLCEEFAVSRQALHPKLKALVTRGKIRVVKRGPRSGYILR